EASMRGRGAQVVAVRSKVSAHGGVVAGDLESLEAVRSEGERLFNLGDDRSSDARGELSLEHFAADDEVPPSLRIWVDDRFPRVADRVLDASLDAAALLERGDQGAAHVFVERVGDEEDRRLCADLDRSECGEKRTARLDRGFERARIVDRIDDPQIRV